MGELLSPWGAAGPGDLWEEPASQALGEDVLGWGDHELDLAATPWDFSRA